LIAVQNCKMSKYGYTGGRIRSPGEIRDSKPTDGWVRYGNDGRALTVEEQLEQTLQKRREALKVERTKTNFDQRFGGPVFKTAKKQKWYKKPFDNFFKPGYLKTEQKIVLLGIGGALIFWGPLIQAVWDTADTDPQSIADRDILIREAFRKHGHRWYAPFIPYRWRYNELLKQDHQNERIRKASQE